MVVLFYKDLVGLRLEGIEMEQELFSDLPNYVSASDPYESDLKDRKFSRQKYKAKFFRALAVLSILSFLGAFSWRAYQKFEFDTHCTENLMYAATTATLPQANISISRAIEYLDSNKLIWGDTNFFFEGDETNDLNAFHGKLRTLYDHTYKTEHSSWVTESDSEIDIDLKLSSVHRSLITTRYGTEEIIKPEGIEHFPYHFASFLWLWISACAAGLFIFICNYLTPKK